MHVESGPPRLRNFVLYFSSYTWYIEKWNIGLWFLARFRFGLPENGSSCHSVHNYTYCTVTRAKCKIFVLSYESTVPFINVLRVHVPEVHICTCSTEVQVLPEFEYENVVGPTKIEISIFAGLIFDFTGAVSCVYEYCRATLIIMKT